MGHAALSGEDIAIDRLHVSENVASCRSFNLFPRSFLADVRDVNTGLGNFMALED